MKGIFQLKIPAMIGFIAVLLGIFFISPLGNGVVLHFGRVIANHEIHYVHWRKVIAMCGIFIVFLGLIFASVQIKNKILRIPDLLLFSLAYFYMAMPILIFFIGYLRLAFGILFSTILTAGILYHLTKNYSRRGDFEIPVKNAVAVLSVVLLWVFMSGIGGYTYQRWDFHFRNAVLRDLVSFSWPIIYPETGNALVYYFNHWMVPAVFGKLFGYAAARFVLYLWSSAGIILSILLLARLLEIKTFYKMLVLVLAFCLYSYSSILRNFVTEIFTGTKFSNILNYRFSQHTELVYWVFNQSIVPFVAMPLFLNEKKLSSLALIGLCVLPFAPFPFIGFFLLFVLYAAAKFLEYVRERKAPQFFKEVFSIPNTCAVFSVFVVFIFFFACNSASNGSEGRGGIALNVPETTFAEPIRFLFWLLVFYASDIGVGHALVFRENRKNPLFYFSFATLMLIPFVKIGQSNDFCWRASIPANFLLFILILKNLLDSGNLSKIRKYILVAVCASSSIYNVTGYFSDTANKVIKNKFSPVLADAIYTFSDKTLEGDWNYLNFLDTNPQSQGFFKLLAKKKTEKARQKDIFAFKKLQGERGIFLAEGTYFISPKTDGNLFLEEAEDTSIKNYDGKDLNLSGEVGEQTAVNLTLVFANSYSNSDRSKYHIGFHDKMRLDVPLGRVDEIGSAGTYAPNDSDAQKFKIEKSDGFYKILWNDYALTFDQTSWHVFFARDENKDGQFWRIERCD